MGHAGGRQAEWGSAVGRVYRHTTAEMHGRVVAVIEERLTTVLSVAEPGEELHEPEIARLTAEG